MARMILLGEVKRLIDEKGERPGTVHALKADQLRRGGELGDGVKKTGSNAGERRSGDEERPVTSPEGNDSSRDPGREDDAEHEGEDGDAGLGSGNAVGGLIVDPAEEKGEKQEKGKTAKGQRRPCQDCLGRARERAQRTAGSKFPRA